MGNYKPVDLARREWCVEKEADLHALDRLTTIEREIFRLDPLGDVRELVGREFPCKLRAGDEAAQEHRKQHKVVVLHPHHGILANLVADNLSEAHVGYAVREPVFLVEIHLTGMIMEERPEDGVREAVIVTICNVVVEVYCLTRVLFHKTLVDYGPFLWGDVETRPADPSEAHRLFRSGEGGDKAARGHFEVVFTLSILCDGNWKTIGDDDEVFWRGFGVGRVGLRKRGVDCWRRHDE
jgi:hypothetical protein